jgi:hypothetical protein
VRLSPLVPPFTRTDVSTGGQEVKSDDSECEAESTGSSVHKDQGEYSTEARRSRRRTENVRLSPMVPLFTRTKVSTVQEARRSRGQRLHTESSGASVNTRNNVRMVRRPGGHVGGQKIKG